MLEQLKTNSLKPKRQPLHCSRPVKQTRALLKSNPPRDNWIEGDEIKIRLHLWGGQNLPKKQSPYFRAESCLEKLGLGGGRFRASETEKTVKNLP